MDNELTLFFPDKFNSLESYQFFVYLKKRVTADVEHMQDPDNEGKATAAAEARAQAATYLAGITKPREFSVRADSYTILADNSFEDLCCLLEDNGTMSAKALTTYEFFKRTEFCEQKFKAQS